MIGSRQHTLEHCFGAKTAWTIQPSQRFVSSGQACVAPSPGPQATEGLVSQRHGGGYGDKEIKMKFGSRLAAISVCVVNACCSLGFMPPLARMLGLR